jgi:hypothetical protein
LNTLLYRLREFKLSGIVANLSERLVYAKEQQLSYQQFLELLGEDETNNRS